MMYTIETIIILVFVPRVCIIILKCVCMCAMQYGCGSCCRASGMKKLHIIILQIFVLLLNLSPVPEILLLLLLWCIKWRRGDAFWTHYRYTGLLICNPRARSWMCNAIFDTRKLYYIIYDNNINNSYTYVIYSVIYCILYHFRVNSTLEPRAA